MSIKADWRLAELLDNDVDPFDHALLTPSLGKVDLSGSEDEVFEALRETLAVEATLYDRQITCDLKDNGQDCLTCPEYAGNRPEVQRAPLCRLGRDQRTIQLRAEELAEERRRTWRPLITLAEDYIEELDGSDFLVAVRAD